MPASDPTVSAGVQAQMLDDLVVTPRHLSATAFLPFGELIEPVGTASRHLITSAFETDGLPSERLLWVYQLPEPGCLPLRLMTLERHPHSAQLFSPLSCSEFLVAVCPTLENGMPDLDKVAAFVARSGQGIVYRRNVWHHPMVALGGPAVFTVSLARGCVDDTVSFSIDRCVTIAV
jgi:ureidoglycolate lyase